MLWSIRLFRVRGANRSLRPPPRAVAGCEDGLRMAGIDPYGTTAELLPGVSYHRLGALADRGIGDVSRLPVTLKILLENSVRNAGAPWVREGDVEAIASWDGTVVRSRSRARVHACAGPPPGLHRCPGGRRPGSHALRGRPRRRRPDAHRPARAGRPRHRSLGAGGRLREPRGVRAQHRPRVRAQPRAVLAAPLGAAGVPGLPRRPSRHGNRPPDQPRIPCAGRAGARDRRRAHGAAGHAGRDQLAHAHGQRHRRARLGCRRHRGGGLHAGPAALPARAGRGRGPFSQRSACGDDGHRPRFDADRDAPEPRRRQQIRGVLWRMA